MPTRSTDIRALFITANTGVECEELLLPMDWLRERGASITHAAPSADSVQTFRHDVDKDAVVQPDTALDQVDPDDFDVLVVPGGTVNADKLRVEDRAVQLAKAFAAAGKPVAAICHGPWLLVEADLLHGKTLTSYRSLHTDILNAGGKWIDQPVVRSGEAGWTLITSRNPGDLAAFSAAITEELRPVG